MADSSEDWTETNIYGSGPGVAYPLSRPLLHDSAFYLPNLLAAIVASAGIVIGSVGTWASVDVLSGGGLEVQQPWGTVVLTLGIASAIALFVQANIGRTNMSLRWSVPMAWAILIAGVACLAIALVQIVKIRSLGEDYKNAHLTQVGWGLWLVAISSGILCATAPIVAAQVAKAAEAQRGIGTSGAWAPGWRWAAIVVSAGILVVALFNAYNPTRVSVNVSESTTRTVTAPPVTREVAVPERRTGAPASGVLPADATPCPTTFANSEFQSSAVGTRNTSCAFAEAVRRAYVSNSSRNRPVLVQAASPVTNLTYTMNCTGGAVVRCAGGNSAVVYLY